MKHQRDICAPSATYHSYSTAKGFEVMTYIYIYIYIYVTVDAKINLMVQKLKIVLLIYSCSLRNKLSFGTNSAEIEGCVTKLQMI